MIQENIMTTEHGFSLKSGFPKNIANIKYSFTSTGDSCLNLNDSKLGWLLIKLNSLLVYWLQKISYVKYDFEIYCEEYNFKIPCPEYEF